MTTTLESSKQIETKTKQLKQSLLNALEERLKSGQGLRGLVPDYYEQSYAEDFDTIQSEIIERLLSKGEEVLELSHLADTEIGTAGGMVNLIGADGVAYFSIPLREFDFLTAEDHWVFAVAARRELIDDLLKIRADESANTVAETQTVDRAIGTLHTELETLLAGGQVQPQSLGSQPTIESYLQLEDLAPAVESATSHLN